MKAVILAGGLGTRISEETSTRPKPMVEVGGKPILWHIMKLYSHHGINDFIVCCGYKGYVIKGYFANYFLHMSDVTFDMSKNSMEVHARNAEPWRVTLVDTGEDTMTGGRLKRVSSYVKDDAVFCLTYGDGVGNINITELLSFHFKKILNIGTGGMILTNDYSFARWARPMIHDGRHKYTLYDEDEFECIGWHMYMTPEQAKRGLEIMDSDRIQDWNKSVGGSWKYKDLREQTIYENYK